MASYSLCSDTELIGLMKAGNASAFAEIYRRYVWILHGHAYNKLQDREEARDIVQELFTGLWAKRESIPVVTNFSGYLYTALRNRILNIYSHKRIESDYITSLQNFLDSGEAATDHLVRRNELTRLIEKEILALPPKMREVFELSRKANLSHREIAVQLNLSDKTVKNQVNNALKILRVKLRALIWVLLSFNVL